MNLETIKNYKEKLEKAKKILEHIKDGDTIGFGSGTTAYIATVEIGKYVKEKKIKIKSVPTSNLIKETCEKYGIETIDILNTNIQNIDWCFDGCDEYSQNGLMIKGLGGALYKEKLVMKKAKKILIVADKSKFVSNENFGKNTPIPIEINKNKTTDILTELSILGIKKYSVRQNKIYNEKIEKSKKETQLNINPNNRNRGYKYLLYRKWQYNFRCIF
jgi:ribose 5-phosphate isomerase A